MELHAPPNEGLVQASFKQSLNFDTTRILRHSSPLKLFQHAPGLDRSIIQSFNHLALLCAGQLHASDELRLKSSWPSAPVPFPALTDTGSHPRQARCQPRPGYFAGRCVFSLPASSCPYTAQRRRAPAPL